MQIYANSFKMEISLEVKRSAIKDAFQHNNNIVELDTTLKKKYPGSLMASRSVACDDAGSPTSWQLREVDN